MVVCCFFDDNICAQGLRDCKGVNTPLCGEVSQRPHRTQGKRASGEGERGQEGRETAERVTEQKRGEGSENTQKITTNKKIFSRHINALTPQNDNGGKILIDSFCRCPVR